MATLKMAIDARRAKQGAAEFNRASDSMKRSAEKATKSIGLGFSSAMTRILMFGGAGGAIYTLKKFIDSASIAEETMSKFNVVFGINAKEAAAWAETFGDSVGRATQDVQKWMAGLQDLFVPLGFARKEAMELSKNLTTLAVDVASFNNKVDAEVIRDFTSALVGNHETVRKFGIIISETSLAQEALNQNLGKAYKDLTDLEKVQLRYSLILKGTTDAQGDAVRTSDSFANQLKRSGANAKDLAVILSGPLTKALAGVLKVTNELSGDLIKTLRPELTQIERIIELLNEYDKLKAARLRAYQYSEESGKRLAPWDPNALPKLEPQPLPGGSYYLQPEHMQRLAESESKRQKAAATAREAEAIKRGAAESAYSKVMLEDVDRYNEIALRRIQITADMYGDMKGRGVDYYNSQKALVDLQYDEYSEFVTNKVLLEKWYAGELTNLEGGILEETQRMANEQLSVWDRAMQQRKDLWKDGLTEMEAAERDTMQIMQQNMDRTQSNWVNFWDPVIDGSKSAKEAAIDFFSDFFLRLAQAKAQMAMLNLWNAGVGSAFGGVSGAVLGSSTGNVFDRGRLVPMANGGIFDSPTYFPLADGKTGLIGEGGLEAAVPLRKMRSGRLGVETSTGGTPVINNEIRVKMVVVSNQREATIEAMKTDDGEKAIIRTLYRNGFTR